MSDEGFQASPEDQRKAQAFFKAARDKGNLGQYDYAIELFLQGFNFDPDDVDAHRDLRELSLKRKAGGGKPIGMLGAMKLKGGKEGKEALLNAEKLLANDPGQVSYMSTIFTNALKGDFKKTAMWIGKALLQANKDSGREDIKYYLQLKDGYTQLRAWREAVEAAHHAVALRPGDMDLNTELKHLGAQETMAKGKYEQGGNFRDSVKDMDKQRELMVDDGDVRHGDQFTQQIARAEAEFQADPNEPGKLMKLVDLLGKSEDPERENHAIELLEAAHQRTRQYRFRKAMGEIKIAQLKRMERSMRAQVNANPNDAELKKDYYDFRRDQLEQELQHFQEASAEYPTDSNLKYQAALRLVELKRYEEAIPALQEVRSDPKYRVEASIVLGRAFMDAGFADEAVDTFKDLIESYQIKGDDHAITMYYYYGRSLEAKNDVPAAIKAYSQVAQWKFAYRDVQQRIKKLRGSG